MASPRPGWSAKRRKTKRAVWLRYGVIPFRTFEDETTTPTAQTAVIAARTRVSSTTSCRRDRLTAMADRRAATAERSGCLRNSSCNFGVHLAPRGKRSSGSQRNKEGSRTEAEQRVLHKDTPCGDSAVTNEPLTAPATSPPEASATRKAHCKSDALAGCCLPRRAATASMTKSEIARAKFIASMTITMPRVPTFVKPNHRYQKRLKQQAPIKYDVLWKPRIGTVSDRIPSIGFTFHGRCATAINLPMVAPSSCSTSIM
mmetsp:Transcript_63375/g.148831  ORF Transcript_63375/g.148831 Transcript_63375/m.148831 type:complete len:258 (+) Transcript_63375:602-1375(+)